MSQNPGPEQPEPRERPTGALEPGLPESPWPAMWALVLGFFMILVDSTIVSIATPALMRHFAADINTVLWVTSAYLLAYAVPLLITGRLGDRIGPKRVYLAGLIVFQRDGKMMTYVALVVVMGFVQAWLAQKAKADSPAAADAGVPPGPQE